MREDYGFDAALREMAARLDKDELSYEGGSDGGWGQFLDGPKEHPQVGPYGLCAGVIVRSLAGRDNQGPEQRAVQSLARLLADFQAGNAETQKLFSQNLRLAFLCLALRLAGPSVAKSYLLAEGELFGRILADGTWGDWWVDEGDHDPTPRPFVTAMVAICLLLFRSPSAPGVLSTEIERLQRAAASLVKSIQEVPDLPVLPRAAALAAIGLTTIGKERLIKRNARTLNAASGTLASDFGVYFFDFQYRTKKGRLEYSRDYFIVPMELMIAIVGFMPASGASAHLLARQTTENVAATVMKGDGAYRSSTQQRISTKNQAWAAIVLKLATRDVQLSTFVQRLLWIVTKPRSGGYVDRWLPPVALLTVTGLAAVPSSDSLAAAMFRAIAVLIIGGLYASSTIRQLVMGRA